MTATDTHRAIETVWRLESPKIIASLTRIARDLGRAEELAQEALVAALEQWPVEGIPNKPGAWLMAIAKRRAVDGWRRDKLIERKDEQLGYELQAPSPGVPNFEAALDVDVGDDLLRLVFTACHPILPTEARVALTLRLLGGLTTEEIARAYLVPEPTIAQRIVRAKRTLAAKRVPYEVPSGDELAKRLPSVLEVIYLIFNEGYTATAGDDWMRPGLCDDALRLVRIVAELLPREPEVHGLAALLEIQASRFKARVGPAGEPILLLHQDRRRWDQLLICRGLAALDRAASLGSARGPYVVQALIAACHARARAPEETDWATIARLYADLQAMAPSPVVELNRAVAVGMAEGPLAGLDILDAIANEPVLRGYHLLPSVRGDLLFRLGRVQEARPEFERAASLTRNARVRELLLARARSCAAGHA